MYIKVSFFTLQKSNKKADDSDDSEHDGNEDDEEDDEEVQCILIRHI